MQKHNDAIKTSGHSSFEKIYLSLYSEVRKGYERFYWVRGELETEQNSSILTPTLVAITTFLSCSPGLLNRGPGSKPLLGHGSHSSIFSPTNLNFLSPGLYSNLTSTYFLRASQFALNSTPRQSRSPLISSTGCTCYLHRRISSFDSLTGSEVNMQHNSKAINSEKQQLHYLTFS